MSMSESNGGGAATPAFEAHRILLAVNPGASNVHLAKSVEIELRDSNLNLPITVVETLPDGLRANQDHFAEHLEEGDCIVAVTGDGGLRAVLSALLLPELRDKVPKIAATTVGGGDQCDMRWALHGSSDSRPSEVIQNGLVRPTRAITWSSLFEDKLTESIAFSYNGNGKTAIGAGIANAKDYHEAPKFSRQAGLVYETLRDRSHFTCEWLGGIAAAEPEELSDVSFFAGPRMAGHFYPRSRLYDQQQRLYVVRTGRGVLNTIVHMGLLAGGAPIGTLTNQELKFRVEGDTGAHFDGEGPLIVPSGSVVTVDRHPTQINLIYSPHMLPPHLRPKD